MTTLDEMTARYFAELEALVDEMTPEEVAAGKAHINNALIPPIAQLLGMLLEKEDGTLWNHIGWTIGGAPEPVGMLEMTLQRVSGETPLQQRDRYKAEAERLRQSLATLADAVAAERAAREYWRGVDYHADTLVALAVAEQAAREVLQ